MSTCAKVLFLLFFASIALFVYLGTKEIPVRPLLKCGAKPERPKLHKRIVGGSSVDVGVWPWHVAILYRSNATAPLKHHCEGTIIATNWVVTAASCVYHAEHAVKSNLRIKAGTVNLQVDGPETQEVGIAKIIRHRYFNPISLQRDIALLELDPPLEFNNFIYEICTPDEFTSASVYGICHISGYDESGVLQETWVEAIPRLRCNMKTWWNFRVTTDMMCAGRFEGGADGCPRNIGGPMNCYLTLEQRYYLQGIRVSGDLCGVPRRPNIYLKISNYYLWLEKYLQPIALQQQSA